VATDVRSPTGEEVTEVFTDAAGALVATLHFSLAIADGGVRMTQTITCAGQDPEPYQICLPPLPDAGPQGRPGGIICTDGTCM
jgi:hypothetical protein